MSAFARRTLSGLSLLCALSTAFAAGPAIGLAVANGSFQLDRSRVWGNATLFDGSAVETNITSSDIRLATGVSAKLGAQSRATIHESRLVLEKGIGQLDSANYYIEADGLEVMTDQAGATARVKLAGPNRVIVAARQGTVRVNNSEGVLIARLERGHEMSFEPQDSGATVTKASGILALRDGKFILVDRVTNVTLQVQGPGLDTAVGKLVEITGTVNASGPTVPGASQLVDVTKVNVLVKGKAAAAGAGAGAAAAGGAAAAAGGGLSTAATVAIIGGVAAAGTVGGLAAAQDLPGQGGSKSSTSR
ncbi:MAG TPA: hypothetical protein VMI94_11380 [Bryobacteraceae bacterium]|nr:hypothetical protein [Bryobacteraceae bacterium]